MKFLIKFKSKFIIKDIIVRLMELLSTQIKDSTLLIVRMDLLEFGTLLINL